MLSGRLFGRLLGRRSSSAEDGQRQRALMLAHAALKLYGLHDAEVELLRHGFVQVFHARSTSRDEFALRLYGLPETIRNPHLKQSATDSRSLTTTALRSPKVLHSQLLFLSALKGDTGLPVPEPVPTLDGELVGEVTVAGTPWRRHSALVSWVPGVHKKGEALTQADLFRASSVIGRMHAYAESYVVPEGSEFPRWDWNWAFGESAHVWSKGPEFYSEKEMKAFRQAAQCIRGHLEELGEERASFGLIHRDPNPNNVVFSSEGAGVIDFDLYGYGYYLFDLSVLRRSLNTLPADRRQPLWEALLRGYEDVRPLPERIRSRLERHLDAFNALQRVAAVNRRLQMLCSDTLEPEIRENTMRFLKTSPRWLRRQA